MSKFEQLFHSAKAAKESGFDKEERRRLIESGTDYINEIIERSHPEKVDQDGSHFSGEQVYNIEKFYDFMEGDERDHQPGLGLGNVLRKYGSKERRSDRERLTPEEGRLVSLAVKYFENWFYRKGFLREFEHEQDREFYYAVSAFIINNLAKIKELSENEGLVEDMDRKKIGELIQGVEAFAREYMSQENLTARVEEMKSARAPLAEEVASLKKKAEPFNRKIGDIKFAHAKEYAKVIETLEGPVNPLPLNEVEKQALVRLRAILNEPEFVDKEYPWPPRKKELQDELLNAKGSLVEILKDRIRYYAMHKNSETKEKRERLIAEITKIEKVLIDRLAKLRETKADSRAKSQKLTGLAALAALKESIGDNDILKLFEGLVGNLYDKTRVDMAKQVELRAKVVDVWELRRKEDAISDFDREIERAMSVLLQRENILEAFRLSAESIKNSIKRPAGDLYLIKTILIAAAEQVRSSKNKKFSYFSPDPSIEKTDRREAVFDFIGSSRTSERYGNGDFKKVHYEPLHIPFAQFAAEYMRSGL